MKKNLKHLAWALLAFPLAYSCSQGGDKKTDDTGKTPIDTIRQCYKSSFEGDSAVLNLKITDSTKVEGDLVINYAEKPANNGIVRGEFKGDTLFVDYTFKIGEGATEFSNPLALLKQGDSLKLGVGQIETAFGRSYFVKGKPISFERGKFSFKPADCK
ncbi:MAG: hypothetical protein EOO42_06980 [Flavobacteriales bacterium]|nr:MAG: hypothetical protein EOO42_06980 [Flavobacteriales bacterium]